MSKCLTCQKMSYNIIMFYFLFLTIFSECQICLFLHQMIYNYIRIYSLILVLRAPINSRFFLNRTTVLVCLWNSQSRGRSDWGYVLISVTVIFKKLENICSELTKGNQFSNILYCRNWWCNNVLNVLWYTVYKNINNNWWHYVFSYRLYGSPDHTAWSILSHVVWF